MKNPKMKATKSTLDSMQEIGQKYGVKVTDMSERGIRAIGFLGGDQTAGATATPAGTIEKDMAEAYDIWLDGVREALKSINMRMEDWQGVWPFDFSGEHNKGTSPDDAAMKANRYWWQRQNKSLGRECLKLPGCWLPRGHQGGCQPDFEPGDFVKAEFEGEGGMPGEWMWVRVNRRDDQQRIVYGVLDNEPVNDYSGRVKLGSKVAVSYDKIRDHKRGSDFAR